VSVIVDVYPDYTGTISEEILSGSGVRGEAAIRRELAKYGIRVSRSLGFNNTYAIGMKKHLAAWLGVSKLSDLARHPELKLGFTNEFRKRGDGPRTAAPRNPSLGTRDPPPHRSPSRTGRGRLRSPR